MSDQPPRSLDATMQAVSGRFYGKYRGVVTDNKDPSSLGRIQVSVPAVPGMKQSWASPCVPYAGDQVGFYAIPPIDAKVWVEFEGGDPTYPIWSGCFWYAKEVPKEIKINSKDPSQVKVFKTRVATLWIDDTDKKGQVVLQFKDSSITSNPLTIKLVLNQNALTISSQSGKGLSKVTMNALDISTDSTTLNTSTSKDTKVKAQQNVSISASRNIALKAGANLDLSASQKATLSALNISASAKNGVTISANNSVSISSKLTASMSATGSLSLSGTGSASLTSTAATKVSGSVSLSLGGAAINFSPA